MTVRGFSAAGGGKTVGGGTAVGVRVGAALGVVTVVTVSGGSWGARDVLGDGLGDALGGTVVRGADVTVRGNGAPTVALVDALSPLLMMTAVATAPTATTAPTNATIGRHRRSAGQASSP
jgi:hypothetical protein